MNYLHGEAEQRVVDHVAACAFCTQEVERLRRVDAFLIEGVYRAACPSPEVLAGYALHRQPAPERLRVAAHLRTCVACRRELEETRRLLEKPPSLVERLREAAALALQAVRTRQLEPQQAGLRGRAWQAGYEVEGAVITLNLQPSPRPETGSTLTGHVQVTEPVAGLVLPGQAWLLPEAQPSEPVPTSPIDARGSFVLMDVQPGSYGLLLQVGQVHLRVEGIDVGYHGGEEFAPGVAERG